MNGGKLRNGYTTGSCAAAAAKAAALHLLAGQEPEYVKLVLPEGQKASLRTVRETGDEVRGLSGFWKVRKDAGDDPDVTGGTYVYAGVQAITEEELENRRQNGRGYWLSEYPRFYLDGGPGIGCASLPGLSCPVGHYAINPVPRKMILEAVDEVCRSIVYGNPLLIRIAIPAGAALAPSTFNPRLGIVGGISVLGTSGIVRPMSEDAQLETIRLDIHMRALAGRGVVILTLGNYGEAYLEQEFRIPRGCAAVCSNYIGASVEALVYEGVRRAVYLGHAGKLVKAAAGMRNTHSKYGDLRMETLAELTRRVLGGGCADEGKILAVRRVAAANTTDEAVGILKRFPSVRGFASLAEDVLTETACEVKRQLQAWSGDRLCAEAVVFSSSAGVSGRTEKAEEYLYRWREKM